MFELGEAFTSLFHSIVKAKFLTALLNAQRRVSNCGSEPDQETVRRVLSTFRNTLHSFECDADQLCLVSTTIKPMRFSVFINHRRVERWRMHTAKSYGENP